VAGHWQERGNKRRKRVKLLVLLAYVEKMLYLCNVKQTPKDFLNKQIEA
jgi:hypothetical protein